MEKIDLSKLSPEEKAQLYKQLETEERSKKERRAADIEAYKQLNQETVEDNFILLKRASAFLLAVKKRVFQDFETNLAMKSELYGTKENQQSHTFTNKDGSKSIKIGNRVTDSFDDTATAGIEKIKTYMATCARDENSAALVETIMDLLKKDAKGNMSSKNVLKLQKLANKVQDDDFSEGIAILMDSYKPVESCQFIEAKYKDEQGKEHILPLSVSAFDL
jgi:hypothetical protein